MTTSTVHNDINDYLHFNNSPGILCSSLFLLLFFFHNYQNQKVKIYCSVFIHHFRLSVWAPKPTPPLYIVNIRPSYTPSPGLGFIKKNYIYQGKPGLGSVSIFSINLQNIFFSFKKFFNSHKFRTVSYFWQINNIKHIHL